MAAATIWDRSNSWPQSGRALLERKCNNITVVGDLNATRQKFNSMGTGAFKVWKELWERGSDSM